MKKSHQIAWTIAPVLVASGWGALPVGAQPSLAPPPGPVALSMRFGPRTEIRSLPYTIVAPGSYYLGASLTQTGPGTGITINSSNVTLDLMGFSIIGAGFAGDDGIGFGPAPIYENITIHDGMIVGWGGNGIDASGAAATATQMHISGITADSNVGAGISVGSRSIVRNCIANENGAAGFVAAENCKLTNCVATLNLADGIVTLANCHISDSIASSNTVNGMIVGPNSTVVGSTAGSNGDNGFVLTLAVRMTDCTASQNGAGSGGGDGFFATGDACILGGCAAFNNFDHGFSSVPPMLPGSSVHDCIAELNGFGTGAGDGFNWFRSVEQCTAINNASDGIEVATGGHVFRNTCNSNSVAGIAAIADGNVIEFNNVSFNGATGIVTVANPGPGGNYIAGNRAHHNGYIPPAPFVAQYAFGPFDTFAPISPAGAPVPGALVFAPSFGGNANITY